MSKYSDFLYGGANYGDVSLVDFSAEPVNARAMSYYEAGIADAVVYVTWATPNGPGTNFVGARLVRNQDAYAETEEDGIIVWSWKYNKDVTVPFDTDLNDGSEFSAIPLESGRYVYYRVWLQKASDNTWVPGGDSYTLIPKTHSTGSLTTGELVSTHDKFMDILPRVYTSQTASPLDEVDKSSALYNFLSGFSFSIDELLTYADLLIPEATGRYQNPNLLLPQADQLGLDISNVMVTKAQKKLIREAIYTYSRKGTALSLGTLAESVTGYAPTITYSPNLMLTNQDSTFNKSIGSWRAVGNAVISSDNSTATPTETYAIDTNYVGKVVVTTAGAKIQNGEAAPTITGIPIMDNTSYSVSWYTQSSTAGSLTLTVSWYDYKGSLISTSSDTAFNAPSSWAKHTYTVTSPTVTTGAPTPRFATLSIAFGSAGTYYLDMIQFAASSVTNFHEARGVDITLDPTKLNYVKNPSFENATGGTSWTLTGLTATYPLLSTATTSLTNVVNGTHMAQLTTSATNQTIKTVTDTVVTGEHYCFSVYLATQSGTATATLTLTDSNLNTKTSANIPLTTAWTRGQVTLRVPISASATTLTATLTILESGKVVNVDAAQVEPAFVASDYFDGAESVATTSWKGTAHNSTSCLYANRVTKVPALVVALYNNLPQNVPFSLNTYGFNPIRDITY